MTIFEILELGFSAIGVASGIFGLWAVFQGSKTDTSDEQASTTLKRNLIPLLIIAICFFTVFAADILNRHMRIAGLKAMILDHANGQFTFERAAEFTGQPDRTLLHAALQGLTTDGVLRADTRQSTAMRTPTQPVHVFWVRPNL